MILFLSDTYGGRTHEKPMADATPSPLPAGSRLLQDLGFLAFTLPQVEILMSTRKPRGQELPVEETRANQALQHRRRRIEHVNSSVKRCRIVKDRIRLWKEGIRDLVMERCCALQRAQVRWHTLAHHRGPRSNVHRAAAPGLVPTPAQDTLRLRAMAFSGMVPPSVCLASPYGGAAVWGRKTGRCRSPRVHLASGKSLPRETSACIALWAPWR